MTFKRVHRIVLLVLACRTPAAAYDRQINGTASTGNYIHTEQEIDLSSTGYRSTIEITSNVPVTIQRYSDSGGGNSFTFGQQPLPDDMAKVLVTSNCDTSDTLVVPTIDVFENGDIKVVLDGANAEDTDFLSPSSYSAFWTWVSDFCGFNNPFDPQSTLPTKPVVESTPALMADGCTEEQCIDPNGKCADKVFCFTSPCSIETCEGCVDNYCGGCNAICNSPPTCPAGQCLDPEGRCVIEASCGQDPCLITGACRELEVCTSNTCTGCRPLCAAEPEDQQLVTDTAPPVDVLPETGTLSECECQVGAGASSSCGEGEFCQLRMGVCNPKGEIVSASYCGKCAEISFVCTEEYSPVCACDGITTYSNACYARSASASVSYTGKCQATKPAISTGPVLVDGQGDVCQVGPKADSSMTCGAGEFCQLDTGVCNDESDIHEGTCAETPFLCTMQYDPVCACDGRSTYSNACVARSAGVSVLYGGECQAAPTTKPTIFVLGGATSDTPSTTITTVEPGNGLMCNLCEGITTGYVQIPNTNCGEFSQCVNGNMSQKISCSDDLIFDTVLNICNWKSRTTCGPDPECPTSETTSTTPTDIPIPPQPQPPSPTESPSEGMTTTPSADSTRSATLNPSMSPIGVSTSPTGSPNKEATEMPSKSPIGASSSNSMGTPSLEATITDATTVPNTTVEMEGAATSVATTVASNTGTTIPSTATTITAVTNATTTMMPDGAATSAATTEASTTTTKATSFAIDRNFPTSEPTKPSNTEVPTKSPNDLEEEEVSDGISRSNSALNQSRSFSFCVATAFMAIVAVSLVFPGFGGNSNLWGYGKFAVAAVAVSSLYPKSSRVFKEGNVRRSTKQVPKTFPAQNERALQKMCNFNVEVLISGCTHPLQISAPAGRIVDVIIDDLDSKEHEDNPCVSDYEATLNFPVTSETIVLDLNTSVTVETFPEFGYQCSRPVAGRPFVDANGGSLHAMPWVPDDKDDSMVSALSWTGEDSVKTQVSRSNNATNHGRVLLGEEWIQRALGEHASIASFSAFSIALMSNGAPAVLVNDALKAGLDEVRHARTSFEIASKLAAREVGPGPLPESKLEFGQDLKALALAVAREGCLDETLSTFAAAVEVGHIDEVLDYDMQDSPYSNIDRDLLGSIKTELVTIAMDESNHSALAWRTLSWVCSVDSNVCDEVNMDVFEESNLAMRFNQHADSSFGETSRVLHSMKEEWNKILTAHQLGNSGLEGESTCVDENTVYVGEDDADKTLLNSVTENIIRQVLAN